MIVIVVAALRLASDLKAQTALKHLMKASMKGSAYLSFCTAAEGIFAN